MQAMRAAAQTRRRLGVLAQVARQRVASLGLLMVARPHLLPQLHPLQVRVRAQQPLGQLLYPSPSHDGSAMPGRRLEAV